MSAAELIDCDDIVQPSISTKSITNEENKVNSTVAPTKADAIVSNGIVEVVEPQIDEMETPEPLKKAVEEMAAKDAVKAAEQKVAAAAVEQKVAAAAAEQKVAAAAAAEQQAVAAEQAAKAVAEQKAVKAAAEQKATEEIMMQTAMDMGPISGDVPFSVDANYEGFCLNWVNKGDKSVMAVCRALKDNTCPANFNDQCVELRPTGLITYDDGYD